MRIVPQARAGIVERLGRYSRTLEPGLTLIVPFIDRVKPLIDLREQVVSFPPQPVITEDNLVVGIDTVIYFTVTDAARGDLRGREPAAGDRAAHGHDAAQRDRRHDARGHADVAATTSTTQLRAVLDDATGRWGIRVNRVELKSVEPPRTVQEAMEKQMRAERDRRATILTAEGVKQSQILTAEGEKQSAVLRAEGQRTAAILKAEGEAKAIETVFGAIHDGAPDQALLSYQYLQMLPQLAQGEANKIFVIPSEFSQALVEHRPRASPTASRPPPAEAATPRSRDEIDARAAADAEEAAAPPRAANEEAESATPASHTGPREIPPPPPAPAARRRATPRSRAAQPRRPSSP